MTDGPGHDLEELREVVDDSQEHQTRIQELEAQLATQEAALADMIRGRQEVQILFPKDEPLRFCVYGDTQIGSTKERMDCVDDIYANAQARGITKMFHCGDVLDGHHVYKGHEFEVHKHGFGQQRDWFKERMPHIPGIDTYFITGNHDSSFKKEGGVDVGPDLALARPDWHFVGEDVGRYSLMTEDGLEFKVMLMHPTGGTPYAVSYRIQKIIETIPGGNKPHLLAMGHLHKMNLMPNYRNVIGVDAGCTQDQTNFMARFGSAAHKGAWFFEVNFWGEEELQMQVKPEFITFY